MGRSRRREIEIAGLHITVDLPRPLDSAEGFGDSGRVWPGVGEGSLRLAARVGPEPESTSEGFCYDTPSHRLIVEERPDGWTVVIHRDGEFERWASFDRDLRAGEVVVSPRAAERGLSPIAHPLDELVRAVRVQKPEGPAQEGREPDAKHGPDVAVALGIGVE